MATANPYWLTISTTDSAMTAGNDWEPYFYDYTVTNRIETKRVTAGGELWIAEANQRNFLAQLTFECSQPQNIKAFLGGNSFGRTQLKLNEVRTEYTSAQFINLPLKQGVNRLLIMTTTVQIEFDALILREPFVRWIDPTNRGPDRRGPIDQSTP